MACTGVPHIVLHVLCSTRTSGGYYEPSEIRFEGILALYLYKRNRPKGPKIPLNLTSEGLKYPPEVRVEHKTCSTICGTPVDAILDRKILDHVGWGGSGKVKIWPGNGLNLASEPCAQCTHCKSKCTREFFALPLGLSMYDFWNIGPLTLPMCYTRPSGRKLRKSHSAD